jgi:hypothetical protein
MFPATLVIWAPEAMLPILNAHHCTEDPRVSKEFGGDVYLRSTSCLLPQPVHARKCSLPFNGFNIGTLILKNGNKQPLVNEWGGGAG